MTDDIAKEIKASIENASLAEKKRILADWYVEFAIRKNYKVADTDAWFKLHFSKEIEELAQERKRWILERRYKKSNS